MSLYKDMVQVWVERREWDRGFHDHCKELVTAFFRVFSQQTGVHPLRPVRIDDRTPRAERDYSLAEALQPILGEVEGGRTVLCGYAVCMGILLEGAPEEAPRRMLAVHVKVEARDPRDRSRVMLSILGNKKELRLPLVLLSIGVELAPDDQHLFAHPPEAADTLRQQLTWLNACLRNFRRLPPERRGALEQEWRDQAARFGIHEGVAPSPVARGPAQSLPFSQDEATSLRQAETLEVVRHLLSALSSNQAKHNQSALEELGHAAARDIFRLLLAGEDTEPSKEADVGFSFRLFAQPATTAHR